MIDIVFLRLVYAAGLGLLIGGLGFTFFPSRGGFVAFIIQRFNFFLGLLLALAIAWWWGLAALRHWGLRTSTVDLGYFANILWSTLHGKVLGTALSGGSALGWHFSPSLIILSVFYFPWQDPLWLIGIQALVTASGAIALVLTVQKLGFSQKVGLLFALLWLFSPLLRGVMIYDFHEIGMTVGLLAWVTYLAVSGRTAWALLLALVTMGFKEDAAIYVGSLGLVLAWSYGRLRQGWLIIALSAFYYIIVQLFLWDCLIPAHYDYLLVRFPKIAAMGGGLWGALMADPGLFIAPLLNMDRLYGLLMLMLPVLAMPFIRLGGLGLLPPFWLIFGMSVFSPYIFSLHYAAPLIALVIIAAIPGWLALNHKNNRIAGPMGYLMLGLTASLALALPPLAFFNQFHPAALATHPYLKDVTEMAAKTPSQESVTADRFIGSFFSNRLVLKEFPSNLLTDDFYLSNRSLGCPQMLIVLGDLGYKTVFTDPCFTFLSRQGTGDAGEDFMSRMTWMEAEGCSPPAWTLLSDPNASGGSAIYLPGNEGWGDRLANTPMLILPPGNYTYFVKMRCQRYSGLVNNIFIEVRFIDGTGNERRLVGSSVSMDDQFQKAEYNQTEIPFTVPEWGRTYLSINFKAKYDIWWDGAGIEGLPKSFTDYYNAIFLQTLNPGDNSEQKVAPLERDNHLGMNLIHIGREQAGQMVYSRQLRADIPGGEYLLFYLVEADEDLPPLLPFADLYASWSNGQVTHENRISTLNVADMHKWMGVPHLEFVKIIIHGSVTLEIKARDDLTKEIRLGRMWLTPAVMLDQRFQ